MSNIPLSDTREVIERSLFHSIRQELVDKGYLPDIKLTTTHTITGVDTLTKKFIVNGNHTTHYIQGRILTVSGSTGNNGNYTIVSSTLTLGNTHITVSENIPSNSVSGSISMYTYYDDSNGIALWESAVANIILQKGYCIELFGNSTSSKKYIKKIPRIVIRVGQSLPGSLGGSPDIFYTPENGDELNPDTFVRKVLPPQTTDIGFDIHLVSNTAQQARVMHSLVSLALPKRGYVKFYNDITQSFYVENYSYRNLDNNIEGLNEDIYMYTANDVYETIDRTVGNNVKPINEITVETKEGEVDDNTDFNSIVIS